MSVSIVTVVLDAGFDLPVTIESVRLQSYRDVEHIVVDGGSREDTAEVLALYDDAIDKVVRIEDAGIYHAMNAALDHCSNEYVLFLNAKDTLYRSTTLGTLMDCRRPGVDVFFGNHVYVSGRKEYFTPSISYERSMDLLRRARIDHRWLSRLPGHQATFVRRDLLRRLRFDTSVSICADHDLMVRAYGSGATFQYIDETVSHYIGGGFSAQAPLKLQLEWCALYRDLACEPSVVDRFFLNDTPSPFGPQNGYRGEWICGRYPLQDARPELGIRKPIHWCRPEIRLRTSSRHAARAIHIEGYNPFDEQVLSFSVEGRLVATLRLSSGWFDRGIDLATSLAPSTDVDVSATLQGTTPLLADATVALAISTFAFEPVALEMQPVGPGDVVVFSRGEAHASLGMLADGWSHQEDDFIWSVGDLTSLILRVSETVATVVLRCRGNPFADEAQRGVEIILNGRSQGCFPLEADRDSDVRIDVGGAAFDGYLNMRLRPLLCVVPPGDGRPLGVRLASIGFSSEAEPRSAEVAPD